MNCTSGILQSVNCTSGTKLVFIAAWKAYFSVDYDEVLF